MKIGSKLRKFRDVQRLSQKEVADFLGIAQSTYNSWESNKTNFDPDYLISVSELFKTNIIDLLPEGMVLKIAHNQDNKDNSINGFEISTNIQDLTNELLESQRKNIVLLEKERNDLLLKVQNLQKLLNDPLP